MENVMIDIETLGTNANAVILSVAAVEFCLKTGKTGRTFYKKIELSSVLQSGLQIDTETLVWWTTQNADQFKELFVLPQPLKEVMWQLVYWFRENNLYVWANSPAFDLVLLENALKACGLETPWKFYNERCVRTLSALHPSAKETTEKPENAHNALADCYFQIKYCVAAYNQLYTAN